MRQRTRSGAVRGWKAGHRATTCALHGIESIKPLLTTLLSDEPLILRALADLAARTTELRNAITGRDHGRIRSADRSGTIYTSAPPPCRAESGGAS
jgi:hypothetical protein